MSFLSTKLSSKPKHFLNVTKEDIGWLIKARLDAINSELGRLGVELGRLNSTLGRINLFKSTPEAILSSLVSSVTSTSSLYGKALNSIGLNFFLLRSASSQSELLF